jgi:hypothetical protein
MDQNQSSGAGAGRREVQVQCNGARICLKLGVRTRRLHRPAKPCCMVLPWSLLDSRWWYTSCKPSTGCRGTSNESIEYSRDHASQWTALISELRHLGTRVVAGVDDAVKFQLLPNIRGSRAIQHIPTIMNISAGARTSRRDVIGMSVWTQPYRDGLLPCCASIAKMRAPTMGEKLGNI